MTFEWRLVVALPILAALITGCGEFGADTPRAGWERSMNAYAERDYGGLWDSLADASRQDTIRVLTHVKRDPRYRESMRRKFQIAPAVLDTMTPREFFVALMAAVERTAPQAIALRAESARTARFSREIIKGDRATVYFDSEKGGPEKMTFALEADRWRPILERPVAAPGR